MLKKSKLIFQCFLSMMMIFSFLSSVYATGNSLDIQVDVYGKREILIQIR